MNEQNGNSASGSADLGLVAAGPGAGAAIAAAAGQPAPKYPMKPTVGRIVLFTPDGNGAKGQPYPASVTHVHSDSVVNLSIEQDGSFPLDQLVRTSVSLGTAGEPNTWDWMPYQYGQAAKTDAAEKANATEIAELKSALEKLANLVGGDVQQAENRIQALCDVVGAIEKRVGPLETRCGTLESRVSAASSSSNGLSTVVHAIGGRVSSLEDVTAGQATRIAAFGAKRETTVHPDGVIASIQHLASASCETLAEVNTLLGLTPPAAAEPSEGATKPE